MKDTLKIVFQGDSITDASRDKRNYHDMGSGYTRRVTEALVDRFPSIDFEFINQGISGNRSGQLFDRLHRDAMAFEPDIISVMIGINDIWHRYDKTPVRTTDEQYEANLRAILSELRTHTSAKIILLQPYLLDSEKNAHLRPDLDRMLPIVEKLADEYADAYVRLDERFAEAMKTQPQPCYYSCDGVHPASTGAALIAECYLEAIVPLIERL